MESAGLFSGMSRLNRWALGFFVVAKISGAVGVGLGFVGPDHHRMGGWLLGFALCSIFLSVLLCLRQSSLDRADFEREDAEASRLRDLRNRRRDLEREIAELEERRSAVESYAPRRSPRGSAS